MKHFLATCTLVALAGVTAFAQTATAPGLKTLGIDKVRVSPVLIESNAKKSSGGGGVLAMPRVKLGGPAVGQSAAAAGKGASLDRIVQALDGQLIDRFHNTRKFQIVARNDADLLQEEAAATGKEFAFPDADYALILSIDDFQDVSQTASFASLGKSVKKRTIRLSSVGKVYEREMVDGKATFKILETANFQEEIFDTEEILDGSSGSEITGDGDLSDALLLQMTRGMAEKVAQRVANVVFPAKIIAKTGATVTLNIGDGTDVAVGQLWEVFAVGEELIDPDTGVSLGREEASVGKVRITRVNPKFSQATISGEDLGIDKGAIVRRIVQ